MKVIEVKKIDPKPDPMSFESEPVLYWYAGSGHGRVETAPDRKNGTHELMILNDPNIWRIDLVNHSARHMVDHNPPLVVHFQIFGPGIPFEKGKPNLEFGREIEYFKYKQARVSVGPKVDGVDTKLFEVSIEDKKIVLLTDKSDKPLRITFSDAVSTETLQYLRYDEVPSDHAFFEVPAGIKVSEGESLQQSSEPGQ